MLQTGQLLTILHQPTQISTNPNIEYTMPSASTESKHQAVRETVDILTEISVLLVCLYPVPSPLSLPRPS